MRYLLLLALKARLSLSLGAQYRENFAIEGLVALLWAAIAVIPLHIALHDRPPVAGWTFQSALVVLGWFYIRRAEDHERDFADLVGSVGSDEDPS